jgi:hypothetical protein
MRAENGFYWLTDYSPGSSGMRNRPCGPVPSPIALTLRSCLPDRRHEVRPAPTDVARQARAAPPPPNNPSSAFAASSAFQKGRSNAERAMRAENGSCWVTDYKPASSGMQNRLRPRRIGAPAPNPTCCPEPEGRADWRCERRRRSVRTRAPPWSPGLRRSTRSVELDVYGCRKNAGDLVSPASPTAAWPDEASGHHRKNGTSRRSCGPP